MEKDIITENTITENTKKETNKQKPKKEKKHPSWLTVLIVAALIALCSNLAIVTQYKKTINTKEERIELLEKEAKVFRERIELLEKETVIFEEQTSKFLETLDKQRTLSEAESLRNKKNREKLVEWVYKNSSKISRKTAEEIVSHTLTTNFPLMHLAIMKTESSFDPTSISTKGASGIGQQMPKDYKEPLIQAGIISEWRDIFDIPQGVKATEFAWNDKFQLGKGNVLESLKLYYGENDKEYINQIIIDCYYLVYLCNFNGLEEQEKTMKTNRKLLK